VRSDWTVDPSAASMLFMAASAHTVGHKHADDLTFERYELGTRILLDTGRYGYHKDDVRKFVQSTRAHNTVEIDGEDFATRNADCHGSGLESIARTDFGFVLRGRVWHAKFVVTHERTLYYRPQEWLVVEDLLSGHASHEFTQWFHFHEAGDEEMAVGRILQMHALVGELRADQPIHGCGGEVDRAGVCAKPRNRVADRHHAVELEIGVIAARQEMRRQQLARMPVGEPEPPRSTARGTRSAPRTVPRAASGQRRFTEATSRRHGQGPGPGNGFGPV
jgi:hypothetical protein